MNTVINKIADTMFAHDSRPVMGPVIHMPCAKKIVDALIADPIALAELVEAYRMNQAKLREAENIISTFPTLP